MTAVLLYVYPNQTTLITFMLSPLYRGILESLRYLNFIYFMLHTVPTPKGFSNDKCLAE